jgi:putative alpha-1,2-mannosidase
MAECKFDKTQRRVPRGDYDASPGYFDITLADGIRGEATVTAHTAIYRFTFPENITLDGIANSPVVTIDLNDLAGTRTGKCGLAVDPQTGRVHGNGTFRPSFGTGTYELYFCTDFRGGQIQDTGIWNASGPFSGDANLGFTGYSPGGAFTRFEPSSTDTTILVRVGLSFISPSQACRNSESEIPKFEFDRVRRAAEAKWQKKFSVVTITSEGVDADLITIFWSGFYRTMLSPQDYTNENPLWNSTEPYFDSFYCIWDSFRSQHPFLTLVDPAEQARMVRALIDIYKHEGKLPDCRMSLCKGHTQGGSNADVVLADAYLKNLGGSIDWHLAYEAVISDAEEEPKMWDYTGRGGLDSWKTLNFIPVHDADTKGNGLRTRSISRTVEFAYNDFCIAEMADKLGHVDDRAKYLTRAGNWRNLFKEDQNSSINGVDTGFRGFLQPRYIAS